MQTCDVIEPSVKVSLVNMRGKIDFQKIIGEKDRESSLRGALTLFRMQRYRKSLFVVYWSLYKNLFIFKLLITTESSLLIILEFITHVMKLFTFFNWTRRWLGLVGDGTRSYLFLECCRWSNLVFPGLLVHFK